jgi:hypothetical protein
MGTRLVYKWQRKLSNEGCYKLFSIIGIPAAAKGQGNLGTEGNLQVVQGTTHQHAKFAFVPTFPIYAGFSQFEAVEKMNPDIPIGIAKLRRNPDFIKISPFSR